jgi:hypothetical protein
MRQAELFAIPESLVGRIFHARWGYGMTINTFFLVLAETPRTVVVGELKRERITGDSTAGSERPADPKSHTWHDGNTLRLKKKISERDASLYLEHRQKIFRLWDGKDVYYNSD